MTIYVINSENSTFEAVTISKMT